MVHTGIFATSDEILVKAGKDYDTAITEARINDLCKQAEAEINALCRRNFSDEYANLNTDVQGLLSQAASNHVAIAIIDFNMDAFPSTRIAENMVNVLRDGYLRCISLLRDKKTQTFMAGA